MSRGLVVGGLVSWVLGRALDTFVRSERWTRTNHRGRLVRLTGGVAVASGALAGATAAAWRGGPIKTSAVLLAGVPALLAGAYDDLVAPSHENPTDKGWRGHLQAARAGRVSGGAVKVAVIGAGALLAGGRLEAGSSSRAGRIVQRLVSAGLVAGTANLANLFDLRPGRVGKLTVATALALSRGPSGGVAAATGAAALVGLPGDLGETRMLGDLGANPLGALLGLRLAAARPSVRMGALIVVLALNAAGERSSFSKVIEDSAVLRRIDGWGRR